MQLAINQGIQDISVHGQQLLKWRAGRIVTQRGRLRCIEHRWLPYKASRMRVWWESARRPQRNVQCEIFFHQQAGNPDFLVLGYIRSHPRASLSSLYCGLLVLDEVARIKSSCAIVAEVTNDRLSDRLLARWGWERHCLSWRGRHFIKRFYGTYPEIAPQWRERMQAPVASD